MLCVSAALWLAATCLLMRADFSRACSPTEKTTTCDDPNSIHRLECATGVISVQTSVYGRSDSTTCISGVPASQVSNTACTQTGTVTFVQTRCNGKKVCELVTNDFHTSDPCTGTYKYIETDYTCTTATHLITCENSLATLDCTSPATITVVGAFYGRYDSNICAAAAPNSNFCSNPTTIVGDRCNGQSTCTIKVTDCNLGNACGVSNKYLEVSYTCA